MNKPFMSFATESWMGDLSASISGRTLHELRIPGSHNSGSDVLGSSVAPGKPQVYAAVPCIIRGWSECQVECVLEQLRAGCRYIDLRTAAVKGKLGLRIVHGLVGRTVLEVLEQVSTFLAASPQEVVVLDFQHFYDVTQAEQATLLAQCLELFSAAGVIPPAKAKTATLAELWAAKTRVLLLWGDVQFVATRPDVLCPRPSSILSPWAGDGYTQNARSRRKFRRILEAFMAEDAEDDTRLDLALTRTRTLTRTLYRTLTPTLALTLPLTLTRLRVLQTVSGPNVTMVVTGLLLGCGALSNLKSHGRAMNKDLERWLRGAWRVGLEVP